MGPPTNKERPKSRDGHFGNDAMPALELNKSVMSFGGDGNWPSPAHTNLGSHIWTLQVEENLESDNHCAQKDRKNLFTSPLVINNGATAGQNWDLTPKSIEKQTSDNLLSK